MIKAAMFDSKPYDVRSFEAALAGSDDISLHCYESRLELDTADLARGAEVVIAFVNDNLNREVLEKLHSLGVRLIALRCAGFNNVDIEAAFGKIHIIRVPAYSPYAIAEHAMALLLCSVRRIYRALNRTRDYNFSLNGLTGFDLHGKTVGVIGAGKIGRAFIDICAGFGMRVLAYDKFPPQAPINAEFTDLERIFAESDVISLHCPLTDENYHLLGREAFARMKRGAIIVNTSRGGLIDAEELLEAIKARRIGAACLDVYEEESDIFFSDRSGHILGDDILARLLTMPNVYITSHQAFLTEEALAGIAETTLSGIRAFFAEEPLENELCYRCARLGECRSKRAGRCF